MDRSKISLLLALTLAVVLLLVYFRHPIVTIKVFSQGVESKAMWSGDVEDPVLTEGQDKLNILRQEDRSRDLLGLDVDELTERQKELTLHTEMDNVDVVCHRIIRMGNVGDGGWEVCDDLDVRPIPPCIIYSFGINNEFSFDDHASTYYGCHVYSFDPSMKADTHDRSDLVHFYKWGLSGRTQKTNRGWEVFTLGDIRQKLGHSSLPITVLKVDVENAEWGSVPDMLDSGQLDDVKQVLLEFHLGKPDFGAKLKVLQSLKRAGFRKFLSHKNPACKGSAKDFPGQRTRCYEVYYMRV